MDIYLKELSVDDGKEYYDVLMELSGYPDAYAKPLPDTDMTFDEFKDYLKIRVRMSTGEGLPKSVEPTTTYWVMDGERPVGYATLKHHIDENKVGGHFGLCLIKEYQNKGLGTLVSDMLSHEAYYTFGLPEVVFTSKSENVQSQKSVNHIGAKFYSEHDGYKFYKLDLEEKFKEKGRE